MRDSTGAVIRDAKVILTNEGTGQAQTVQSGSAGEYNFSPVRIGRYKVSAELRGFQNVEHSQIKVDVQQHVLVDLVLTPGQSTQTITVSDEPPALQTQDASVGQVIGTKTVNDLPLNGRNFTFLAQLSAGVTQDQADGRGLGASGSFAANGSRPAQNNYLLDGIDNNSNLVDFLNGTAYAVLPPVDAIEEFRVQTNNYSAELGRSAGAVLNATVKSGTNEFHGNAWEFLRNDALDAANFFENAGGLSKGAYRQNQFGFTIGGPVKKNKTFFFADYQGTRIRQAVTSVNTVPSALERGSGYTDFSELLTQGGDRMDVLGRSYPLGQIFDPATTRAVTCGVQDAVSGITAPCGSSGAGTQLGFVREPFAQNALPLNRLNANAIKLLNLYPAPNGTGLFYNYTSNRRLINDVDQFDVRGDQNFSEHDTLFARVSHVINPQFLPGPFPGFADGGGFGSGTQNSVSWNGVLSETHLFSPTTINEARIGVNRIASSRLQAYADTYGIPQQYGISGIPQFTDNGGLPTINISGLTQLGGSGYLPSVEYSTVGQFSDTLTKNAGNHSMKAGYIYQRLRFSVLQPPASRGNFSFSGNYTEVPNTTGGNTGIAQMLLTPVRASVAGGTDYLGGVDFASASNYANTDSKRNYNGLYFQDDYKVTPRLTLNLGLRWEYFGPLIERYGAQSNFQPLAGGGANYLITKERCNTPLSPDFLAAAAQNGVKVICSSQPGLQVAQKLNFSPRVGFAYQALNRVVIRGGYGVFYGGFENSSQYNWGSFPFQYHIDYNNVVPNQPITYANGLLGTLDTGLSGIPLRPDQVAAYGVSVQGEDYRIRTPYTQGYNFTIQFQVSQNQTVQLGYVGNTVRHLGVYINPNTPSQLVPPSFNSLDYSPYPNFAVYNNYTSFAGNSFYNGLQATYEHRLSAGLSLLANFTWSKCRTDAVDLLNATAVYYRAPLLPGFGIKGDYGLCDFDIPKVFHLSGTYDLPFGRGRHFLKNSNGLVNVALGGWSTNYILTLQDGQPGTVTCVIATAAGLGCNALLVPGQDVTAGPHNVDQWLNAAAFASPPVVTSVGQRDYSPLGGSPTQFYGPGFHRLDFSVFKTFPITERTRVEFRSEFFNLTNTPNFAAPAYLDYTNPTTFGKITSTRDGQNDQREIQFALKLYW
ncbi:MAG: TonB-dependent receptor [Acidobacteriaceae bacterium]|nr:TonB-dependent receptor [Acidobacteriaceae bacterium]